VGIHSHLQSPEEIEVRTFHQNIKRRVINETTAITKIYDEELARQQMSQTAAAIMPSSYEASMYTFLYSSLSEFSELLN
ncbi:unnamed protein product, partial [Rotaria magnacalcarata]